MLYATAGIHLHFASIETGQVFKAIESAIPTTAIDQVIAKNAKRGQRQRKLSAHLVACLVIAMSLWSKVAMRDVLKNLVDGLNVQWTRLSQYWKTPNSASITEARQRLGSQVMRQLFELRSTSNGNSSDPWSLSRSIKTDGNRWHIAGCTR